MLKTCTKCGVEKDTNDFTRRSKSSGGLHPWCKSCTRNCSKTYDSQHGPRRNERARKYNKQLKTEAFQAYGGKCVCCGESRPEFLTIDHINGDGQQHRKSIHNNLWRDLKRQGFPKDKYRLLCWNCNCSLGIHGYCPHANVLHGGWPHG